MSNASRSCPGASAGEREKEALRSSGGPGARPSGGPGALASYTTQVNAFESEPPIEHLSAELEHAALVAVRAAYHELNYSLFRHRLVPAVLAFATTRRQLGRWRRAERAIELSRSLLVEHDWGTLVEVLKHEMAHQFVDEVLQIHDESVHGRAFQQVCAERAIDGRATGLPQSGPSTEEQRVLERVAKLLALAESSNEHEAHNAALAAQRLMLRHNLDSLGGEGARSYAFRHLGEPSARVAEAEKLLSVILTEHFFVDAIWVPVWRAREAKRGSVLEICGTAANLELAAYAYDFLRHTAQQLWREHKRARSVKGDADRRHFVAGVMAGFRSKLNEQRQQQAERGLVWVGDAGTVEYLRARHPHIRHTRSAGAARPEAYAHGKAAGRSIVLHRGVSAGASGSARLLPGKRG